MTDSKVVETFLSHPEDHDVLDPIKDGIEDIKKTVENNASQEAGFDVQQELLKIKEKTEQVNTSVENLHKEIEILAKDKTTLAKEIIEQKQKSIDEQKLHIEQEKQDTLAMISRVELANLKNDVLGAQKDELQKYKDALSGVQTQDSSFWEKMKQTGGKIWETTKVFAKEHPILTASVVGLAAWGIYKLFKRNKKEDAEEKDEKGEKEEKKSFWDGGFGKVLKWGGLILGGGLVWKNWDKITGWIGGLFGKDKPTDNPILANDFDSLSEGMKTTYKQLATDVDSFSQKPSLTVPQFDTDSTKDQEKKAGIIFDFDKNIGNLSKLNTVDTLDYIEGETSDDLLDMLKNGTKGLLYNALSGFLMRLESFKPFGMEFVSDPASAFEKWLKAGTPEEREKELSLFYREYMNIHGYLTEKKHLILEAMAKEKILGSANVANEPTEDQQELIETCLKDESWLAEQLKNFHISDIPGLMKKYGVEVAAVTTATQEILQNINEDKNNVLDLDADGESAISRAESDFADGTLEEDTREELIDLCENLGDDLFGDETRPGFFASYTHLLTDLFAGNTQLVSDYMDKSGSQEMINELKVMLEAYIARLKNNTFSQQDLQDLKNQTSVYFAKKEEFILHMDKIDESNQGGEFKVSKLLNSIFIESFKDIGKAFGAGKTNSWWERTGRGLGGAVVGGGALYLTGSVAKVSGAKVTGNLLKIAGKSAVKIGMLPVEVAKKGLTLSLGRTFLTGHGWAEALNNSNFTLPDKERLIKYAFLRGEISDHKALVLFERVSQKTLSIDSLLDEFGIKNSVHKELFKKYGGEKNIRKLLFRSHNDFQYHDFWKNVEKNTTSRLLRKDIQINVAQFDQLAEVDSFLGRCTHAGKAELVKGFLKTTKSLNPDIVKGIFDTAKFDHLAVEECSKIGKLLGKHITKFVSVDDFNAWTEFMARNYRGNNLTEAFVKNSLSKWKTLKTFAGDAGKESVYIAEKSLEKSTFIKRIEAMKDNFKKSVTTLRNLRNRSPYPTQVDDAVRGLEELASVDTDAYRAMQVSQEMGQANWMLTMSKNTSLMQELSVLMKDKPFLDALGKAKTPEAIKQVFGQFNKGELVDQMSVEFVESLAKTKSTKKILDTVSYVEKYESLGKVMKVLESPTMKYAGRILNKTLLVGTVVLGGFMFYEGIKESQEISKTNQERGSIKQQESWMELALTAAGACAFVPGIGWVASGVILGVTVVGSVVNDAVFETLDKYNKNYKDFLYDAPLRIKQHILTTMLGGENKDVGFGDRLVGSFKDLGHLAHKTGSEGMKALLYAEEWKENPLAMVDITDTELMAKLAQENPPISRQQVADAIDQVEKRVVLRYDYLKAKCGSFEENGKTYIDLKKSLSSQENGLAALDALVLESSYAANAPEKYATPDQVEQEKKSLLTQLEQHKESFATLNAFWKKDPKSLLYFYRYTNDIKQHIQQFGTQDELYSQLLDNIDYFSLYMGYITLQEGVDVVAQSQGFLEPDLKKCRDFFVSYDQTQFLSSKEVLADVPKMQLVLYRIATEVIGVKINNTMEDIKKTFSEDNEKAYGLYFKGGETLCVNGNYFADTPYTDMTIDGVKKMRSDLEQKIQSNDLIDMGTGDEAMNKTLGAKYLAIFDQELQRK